jgi:hydrogenase maturation factor
VGSWITLPSHIVYLHKNNNMAAMKVTNVRRSNM